MHLFILNPVAGEGKGFIQALALIENTCKGLGIDYAVEVTNAPRHASELVKQYAGKGTDLRVYACGGDGTLNEVVGGAADFPSVEIAHYPSGSGNDFVRMFGENADTFRDLHTLIDGTAHPVDVIEAGGRRSLNMFSCGFDARVPIEMRRFKWALRFGSQVPYNLGVAAALFHGLGRRYEVTIDGRDYSGTYLLMAFMNGRYYGGGFNPTPHALPHDGQLDIILAKKVSIFGLVGMIGAYAKGKAETLPVCTCLRGREITIRSAKPSAVTFDGESEMWPEATIRILHHAIRFVLPKGLSFDMLKQKEQLTVNN